MSETEDDRAVTSEPVPTDDGGEVVIRQQNMGGRNQVGGGEFKNADSKKSAEQASAEQDRLEREAPAPPAELDDD